MTELWGIIRYAAPEDGADFDGWYSRRSFAQEVYARWLQQYPGWSIALVSQVDAQRSKEHVWPDAGVINKPAAVTNNTDKARVYRWRKANPDRYREYMRHHMQKKRQAHT